MHVRIQSLIRFTQMMDHIVNDLIFLYISLYLGRAVMMIGKIEVSSIKHLVKMLNTLVFWSITMHQIVIIPDHGQVWGLS